jgi:hypothetical protein
MYGSNHRGCFIDISDNIFDNKIQLQRPPKRLIGTNNIEKDIYLTINHRIYDRETRLCNQSKNMRMILNMI